MVAEGQVLALQTGLGKIVVALEASLKREYVTFSNHRSMCAWKGEAHYYSLMVEGDLNPNAVWYYPEPKEAAKEIKGRVAFWKGVKVSS